MYFQQLEIERAEKRKIQEMLDERERRIAQLEREIQLLHTVSITNYGILCLIRPHQNIIFLYELIVVTN